MRGSGLEMEELMINKGALHVPRGSSYERPRENNTGSRITGGRNYEVRAFLNPVRVYICDRWGQISAALKCVCKIGANL